jgi:predicted RNA-binding protein associated with RNAse of E/G family
MSIHPPKYITSQEEPGANTSKTLKWHDTSTATLTEIWNEPTQPWQESGTIIARKDFKWVSEWKVGQCYVVTEMYDNHGEYIARYVDICTPVKLQNGIFSFEDMYLDVWRPSGERAVLLDEDELEMALEEGHITPDQAERARMVAQELLDLYNSKV